MGAVAAGISLGVGVLGTAVSAYGAMSSAHAQAANANYQAQIARNNAITAGQNAEYATQAGQEKASEASLRARQQQGEVTTALAASGVDVDTGSAKEAETTQRETGALGTEQVIDNAALQAYGYRTQQTGFTAQSGLDTAEAGQAITAGDIGAAGGLLEGASSVGLNYQKLQNLGAFGAPGGAGLSGPTATDIASSGYGYM